MGDEIYKLYAMFASIMQKRAIKDHILQNLIPLVDNSSELQALEIIQHMDCLDGICNELKSELDPQLVHFFKQRSYTKALASIRSGEIELTEGVS